MSAQSMFSLEIYFVFFAFSAAVPCELCGQKLLTAKNAKNCRRER